MAFHNASDRGLARGFLWCREMTRPARLAVMIVEDLLLTSIQCRPDDTELT